MKKYIYGIDIGGTTIKFGLFDLDLKLLNNWEIHTNKHDNGRYIVDDIVRSIVHKTPNLEEVYGYGFGVPGPVVKNHISVCVNLGWENIDLKNLLKNRLHNDHIFIGNDANVATLGEAYLGAGHGRKNVAMITLGTGVGSGIVYDGLIVEGAFGSAGEIGHLTVAQDTNFRCNCGKIGCLETVASATGVRRLYELERQTFSGDSLLYKFPSVSAKRIFDAAKDGDVLANKVVDKAVYYIAYACHVLSVTTNPEVILLGGGVSKAGEFLRQKVETITRQLAFPPTRNTKIELAILGNDAGIFGAAELVKMNDQNS
jgi:glucokinase